jgi:hypothetical protein
MKATKTKRKAAKLVMTIVPRNGWSLVRDGKFVTFENTVGRRSPYVYRTRAIAERSFFFKPGDTPVRVLVSYRVEAQ